MMEVDEGTYSGDIQDNVPHGQGEMVYKENDPMNREVYTGEWISGSSHEFQSFEGKCNSQMPSKKQRSRNIFLYC